MKVVEFTVEGSGKFPVDMLRYDACWPEDQISAFNILGDSTAEKRQVKLRSCIREPNVKRWARFEWTVTPRGTWHVRV